MIRSANHAFSHLSKLPLALLGSIFSLGGCATVNRVEAVNPAHDTRLYAVSMSRRMVIPTARDKVFDFVVAADVLPKVLTGYGPLPAVTGTSEQSGPWDQPGASRLVHLKDDSTVREQVTGFERPQHFTYQVWDFTNPIIHRLADKAEGEWTFASADDGTHIVWTYTFYTDSRWALLPLTTIVNIFWRGYMDVCLDNSRRLIVQANTVSSAE